MPPVMLTARRVAAAAAGAMAVLVTGCGGASTTAPSTTPESVTPVPSGTATATASAAIRPLELTAPSLGVDVLATTTPCDSSLMSLLPTGSSVDYADCSGYVMFIAAAGGPLDPVINAPGGTTLHWTNQSGAAFHTTIDANTSTLPRDPSTGAYAGHGVSSMTVFFQTRDSMQAKERSGPISSG